MAKHEPDIVSKVRKTATWERWGRRYERQLTGRGEKPFRVADASLTPIPPDTYESLRRDLRNGVDTAPFSDIVEELLPEQIEAVLERYSVFGGNVAVMQFFRRSGP